MAPRCAPTESLRSTGEPAFSIFSLPARPAQGLVQLGAIISSVTAYLVEDDLEELVISSIGVLNSLSWLITFGSRYEEPSLAIALPDRQARCERQGVADSGTA